MKNPQFLMAWNDIEQSLPWSLIFMFVGAFAISDATMVELPFNIPPIFRFNR